MSNSPGNSKSNATTLSVQIGNRRIEVIELPGSLPLELISPAIQLIAGNIEFRPDDRVILFGCGHGELAAYLIPQLADGRCSIVDHNYTAIKSASLTLQANQIPLSSTNFFMDMDLPADLNQTFTTAVVHLPKGRLLARRWLIRAYNALIDGGRIYLAGSNAGGIQSTLKDAQELFGEGSILAYKKGNRIARFTKSSVDYHAPAWTQLPGLAPHTWLEFLVTVKGQEIFIHSLPGVFSYDHLDDGTSMLLDIVEIVPGSDVLDMGCGYGVIGLYAASQGAGRVDMVDDNLLAIAASRETCRINRLANVDIYPWDLLNDPICKKYTIILSNPPFHSGHAVDYQVAQAMIRQSNQALLPNGKLVIVANRFIRYDRLIKEVYGNVSILSESGKFHVLSGLKST